MDLDDTINLVLDHTRTYEQRWAAFLGVAASRLSADEKVRILNLLLKDHNRAMRLTAVVQAGEIGDNSTVEILREMIKEDDDEELEANALRSLALLMGTELVPTLVDQLWKADEHRQLSALTVLFQIGSTEARKAIRDAFQRHPTSSVRFRAAVQLAALGEQQTASVLLAHIRDERWLDQIGAVLGLCRLGLNAGLQRLEELVANPPVQEPERTSMFLMLRAYFDLLDKEESEVIKYTQNWIARQLGEREEGTRTDS